MYYDPMIFFRRNTTRAVDSVVCVILCILLFGNKKNYKKDKEVRLFNWVMAATLFSAFVEGMKWYFWGLPTHNDFLTKLALFGMKFFTFLDRSCTNFIGFWWLCYLDFKIYGKEERISLKGIGMCYLIPSGLAFLVCVINLFVPIFYYIDEDKMLRHIVNTTISIGDRVFRVSYMATFSYLVSIFNMLFGQIMILCNKKSISKHRLGPLLIFVVFPAVGEMLNLWNGVSFVSAGLTLSILVIYVTLQSESNLAARQEVEDALANEKKALQKERESHELFYALSNIYYVAYIVDLEKSSYKEFRSQDYFKAGIPEFKGDIQQQMLDIVHNLLIREFWEVGEAFVDLSTLDDRMKETDTVSFEYLTIQNLWARGSFVAVNRNQEGKLTKILYVSQLIDQRKRQELERQAALEDRNHILDAMKNIYNVVIYCDVETNKYFYVTGVDYIKGIVPENGQTTESASKWLAMDFDESNFKKSMEFFDYSTVNERMKGKEFLSAEMKTKKSGWCRIFLLRVNSDKDGNLRSFLVMSRTIDVEKRAELEYQENLKIARDAALSASRAKSEFLSHMSHDIRTPLNGIAGMTQIATETIDDKASVQDCLEKIGQSTRHLTALINDVLDISRIENGKKTISNEPLNIKTVLSDCLPIIQGSLEDRKIDFRVIREPVEHPYVFGDSLHIRQILINIIGNSVKFTPDGGKIIVEAKNRYLPENKITEITYIISDTGIGMSQEFLAKIFEPFSQEKETARTNYKGTGLGMTIAKSLTELMGGTLDIESEKGKGTKVSLTIPLRIDEDAERESENPGSDKNLTEDLFAGLNVLLVEDNDINKTIAKFMLEKKKMTVDWAQNGKIGFEKFRDSSEGTYNLVLMDIMMPEMDGYESTTAIRALEREDAKKVPIIAMTANAFLEDVEKARKLGMNAHVAKPIEANLLYETLAKCLAPPPPSFDKK